MGKVDAFSIDGLRLTFYSLDHLPMHFHATRTDKWEIRVAFLDCTPEGLVYTLKWGGEPSGKDRAALLKEVLQHRDDLVREWEAKVCTDLWPNS